LLRRIFCNVLSEISIFKVSFSLDKFLTCSFRSFWSHWILFFCQVQHLIHALWPWFCPFLLSRHFYFFVCILQFALDFLFASWAPPCGSVSAHPPDLPLLLAHAWQLIWLMPRRSSRPKKAILVKNPKFDPKIGQKSKIWSKKSVKNPKFDPKIGQKLKGWQNRKIG